VYHWQSGRFNMFRVNPPLVRMVGALPVLASRPATDWGKLEDAIGARPEFEVGEDFLRANIPRWSQLFTVARWGCIPFSLLGGWVCYRWARQLYGARSGLMALAFIGFTGVLN
jgi:hypothetical protein